MERIKRGIKFLKHDIWRIRSGELTRSKAVLVRQLRIVLLALRGFGEDKCQLRASALTFYSLLSIVPVAAMAFGIAKGFGLEKKLEAELISKFAGHEEVMARVIEFANSLLENTKGSMMAGVGVIVLLWSVIKVLAHIEHSFNEIWELKKRRSIGRTLSDYLSVMLVSPILLILSSSVTVYISTQAMVIAERVGLLGVVGPFIEFFIGMVPYLLVWLLFTFIYVLVPNTKVKFSSALIAGVVAGTIYQLTQLGYISFQVGIAKYSAIYGSFAALPLFLIWLQLSWLIVLFGAELSFAVQNEETYEFEEESRNISHSFKRLLSLQIAHMVIRAFEEDKRPYRAEEISHALEVPIRLVRHILYDFVASGLFSEVAIEGAAEDMGYQPAHSTSDMTIYSVTEALDGMGEDSIPILESDELNQIKGSLEEFGKVVGHLEANKVLKDL